MGNEIIDKDKFHIKCKCTNPEGKTFLGTEHDGNLCVKCKEPIFIKLKEKAYCSECGKEKNSGWINPMC